MIERLDSIRSLCRRPADAIRWACLLEATAPKAGNVYPGRDFDQLRYTDFVIAAEITAASFESGSESFSTSVLEASETVNRQLGTNVNLGILLLIGPLHQADSSDDGVRLSRQQWRQRVSAVLTSMTAEDARRLYSAINVAAPGSMGQADEMDLSGPPPGDFLAAMRSAKMRDRIAWNYADGFNDLFQSVTSVVSESIGQRNDLLGGIALAHLRLLSSAPDSLIARKFGAEVAVRVQQRADFDHNDHRQWDAFDRFLRKGCKDLSGKVSGMNPGTTADLIAASLYILLREQR